MTNHNPELASLQRVNATLIKDVDYYEARALNAERWLFEVSLALVLAVIYIICDLMGGEI